MTTHRHKDSRQQWTTVVTDPDLTLLATKSALDALALRVAALEAPTPVPTPPTIPDAPAGWIEVMNEPFATDVPEGGFTNSGHAAYPLLNPYDAGWTDTSRKGTYSPAIASVSGGVFRARLRTINGKPTVFAMTSFPPGCGARGGYLSGRVSTLLRADLMPGYKIVPMLWTDAPSDPVYGSDYPKWRDGELDLPEGDLDGSKLSAFFHYADVQVSVDPITQKVTPLETPYQKWIDLGVTHLDWHVYTIEWVSGQYVAAIVDGVEKGRLTARVPHVPMHANWQFETNLSGTPIDPATTGNVEIGHIRQWRR